MGGSARRGAAKRQRIRAQAAVNAAEWRYLNAQAAGIYEDQADHAGLGNHDGVCSCPADVARPAQRHAPQAVLPRLFYCQIRGQDCAHLPKPTVRVYHRRAGAIAHNFRCSLGINAPFAHGARIFIHAQEAVGIMAVEVGLHQVIGNDFSVVGTTAQSSEEFLADAA